jgi:hypothetical protein
MNLMKKFLEVGMSFCLHSLIDERANGLRYPLVGGTRQRHFSGNNLKPHKLPENAQTPTSRVHALLAALTERRTSGSQETTKPILKYCTQQDFSQSPKKI